MYSIDQSGIGEQFCLLAQRARISKKILRFSNKIELTEIKPVKLDSSRRLSLRDAL